MPQDSRHPDRACPYSSTYGEALVMAGYKEMMGPQRSRHRRIPSRLLLRFGRVPACRRSDEPSPPRCWTAPWPSAGSSATSLALAVIPAGSTSAATRPGPRSRLPDHPALAGSRTNTLYRRTWSNPASPTAASTICGPCTSTDSPGVDPVRTARSWTGPRMRSDASPSVWARRQRDAVLRRLGGKRSAARPRRSRWRSSPRYSRGRAGSMG